MKYFLIILLFSLTIKGHSSMNLNKEIGIYLEYIDEEFKDISPARKAQLTELSNGIYESLKSRESVDMIFICTHNSRRSHMAQIWTQVAAEYYGIDNITSYSGGTEATAFNPRAVKAMKNAGFTIKAIENGHNPIYEVNYARNNEPIRAFSKKYSDDFNPQENFIAVMVCSDADEACPLVMGASDRYAIPYNDPKEYDNTDLEEAKYAERCRDIAREMMYVFSMLKK